MASSDAQWVIENSLNSVFVKKIAVALAQFRHTCKKKKRGRKAEGRQVYNAAP